MSEGSLLVTTEAPCPSEAPKAAPSRTAISGVISVNANPETLQSVTSPAFHFSPHTSDVDTIAPSSTILLGHILQLALTVAPLPTVQSSETIT